VVKSKSIGLFKIKNMDQNKNKDQNAYVDPFGLTNLFKGINELLDLAENIEKKDSDNTDKTHQDHLENGMKGVYDLTVNTVLDGNLKDENVDNIKKTSNGSKFDKEREPLTEVLDQKDEIIVIAEMPGVEELDIIIELKESVIKFTATSNNRKYRKQILLSNYVHKPSFTYIYKNGVLEIKIKK
jgi:HSP20 family protein